MYIIYVNKARIDLREKTEPVSCIICKKQASDTKPIKKLKYATLLCKNSSANI